MSKEILSKDVEDKLRRLAEIQKDIENTSKDLFTIDDQIEALHNKKATAQRHIKELQEELNELLGEAIKPARKTPPKADKEEAPSPGTAPYELVQYMSPSTPIAVSELAKKVKKGAATVKQYLGKYNCFVNVRGKGYICTISKE